MSASGFSLYRSLIKPLRENDTTELLRRYLVGPQAIHDQAEETILSLLDQIKPDLVRDDLLQYLLPIVGFTTELRSITDRLDEDQLRKLVTLAVPMWNERHTVSGLINAIRLLTGRTAFVSTWFAYRAVLGEFALTEEQLTTGGDFWIIGGNTSNYDENWSNIRLMDDGTLDELLLIDICRLMRPMGERFEVFLDDFLDRFDSELDKWTIHAGDASIVDGVMFLSAAIPVVVEPTIPIITDQSENKDYNIVAKFKLDAGTGRFVTRWYCSDVSGGTCFELAIQAASPRVAYTMYVAGVATNLEQTDAFEIYEDVWYKLRISTVNVGSDVEHRIVIDNNLMFDNGDAKYTDTTPGTASSGFYLFKATGGHVYLDNVESWRNPGRFALIEIGTPSEPRGAVTMTDNFVLE
jgi:phage tail-like protein